jgi:Flp pilus assembly protein TadG
VPNLFRPAAPGRRGVVSVEFALTAPVFFLLLFAALEFMRFATIEQTVVNAAYEGARRGIVPGATADDVEAEAVAVMASVGARDVTVNVLPATINPDTTEVTVTVEAPMNSNTWIPPVYFADKTAASSCTLRRELIETVSVP